MDETWKYTKKPRDKQMWKTNIWTPRSGEEGWDELGDWDWHVYIIDINTMDKIGPYSKGYGLPSSHVQLWELDHKEDKALINWRFQTVVLEKPFESPLDCKEIKPVNL